MKQASKREPPPDTSTLDGWTKVHGEHGRGGPWLDVVIDKWVHWRCPCGSKIIVLK